MKFMQKDKGRINEQEKSRKNNDAAKNYNKLPPTAPTQPTETFLVSPAHLAVSNLLIQQMHLNNANSTQNNPIVHPHLASGNIILEEAVQSSNFSGRRSYNSYNPKLEGLLKELKFPHSKTTLTTNPSSNINVMTIPTGQSPSKTVLPSNKRKSFLSREKIARPANSSPSNTKKSKGNK
jgi:hypothetical protein